MKRYNVAAAALASAPRKPTMAGKAVRGTTGKETQKKR